MRREGKSGERKEILGAGRGGVCDCRKRGDDALFGSLSNWKNVITTKDQSQGSNVRDPCASVSPFSFVAFVPFVCRLSMRNLNIDGSIQRLTSVDPSIRHLSFSTLPAEQRETKSEKERESASRRRRGRAEREDGGNKESHPRRPSCFTFLIPNHC